MISEIASPIASHGWSEPDRPLHRVLLSASIALLALIVIVVALTASSFSFYMGLNELTRRAETATSALSPVLQGPLATKNRLPRDLLDRFKVDPDVEGAAVIDAEGHILQSYLTIPASADRDIAPAVDAIRWSFRRVTADATFHGPNGTVRLSINYSTDWSRRRATRQLLLFLSAGFAAAIVVALILRVNLRRQLAPWKGLIETMTAFVERDYTHPLPALDNRSEIGAVARAAAAFRTKLIEHDRFRAEADVEQQHRARVHAQIEDKVDHFRATIHGTLNEVAGLGDQMTLAADGLKMIAAQTNERAGNASTAIKGASSNVEVVAAASQELSASIREIERQVEQTRSIVVDATRRTSETNAVIQGLSSKAEEIGDIIGLIQSIAAQTNLLSLNATIEAARAGESGRGFAVVAQEVKGLADQTARASQHVADHVLAIQAATLEAVSAISEIGATVGEAEKYSTVISDAVERQAAATGEISRSALEAARSAGHAADSMGRLASAVGETDQSAAQVHCFATDVGRQAHDLSMTIDQFLRDTARLRS